MIVYVIPGKTKTVQAAVDYICDEEKTAKDFAQARVEYERNLDIAKAMTYEEFCVTCNDGINRALNYISNEKKIGGYISGYLCDPELAEEQFRLTKEINLERVGRTLDSDTGNYFYHIIQSFPEGLEISDEEVHQCGLELVQRLGLYQAVVCSHIHPVIDEEGEAHGKQKHNHIIMNSHMHHELVDESNPEKMKYHSCRESYAQLQLINDQIAIEHGLPIIAEPDMKRSYSWTETAERNKGRSWKERVRVDISNAMRACEDYPTYLEAMRKSGYDLRIGNSKTHGKYVTYTCPDGEHVVRDYVLGKGSTLPELEKYWEIMQSINQAGSDNNDDDGRTVPGDQIAQLLEDHKQPLFVRYEVALSDTRKTRRQRQNLNERSSYTHYLPLELSRNKAELSYFDASKNYEIVDAQHQIVTVVSGSEVAAFYSSELLRQNREKEERRVQASRTACEDNRYISSKTKRPYRIGLYDERGRKRTLVELVLILAAVVIKNEYDKWQPKKIPEEVKREPKRHPIYASKDRKIQAMVDMVRIAREEGVQTVDDVIAKAEKVGKEISKARAEVRRLTGAMNRMDTLAQAISTYREIREICEPILEMPDGPEKAELLQQHAEDMSSYKSSKAIMYRHEAVSEEAIQDFARRYEEIRVNLQRAKQQEARFKEDYRRLKKLEYGLQLAQNKQYCYGPEYGKTRDIGIDR